jgi:predicted acylesterase/phospholipase RssA
VAKRRSRTALVCAGGGVTGAVYQIGVLRALEDVLDRGALDHDIYVGVSGGAFVASLLAHGVSPGELYDEALDEARQPLGVTAAPLYRLGLADVIGRSARAPGVLVEFLRSALGRGTRNPSDLALSLFECLPAGLVDNSGIQEYLAKLFRLRGHGDRFADLTRELYLIAVDLDDGRAVAFGESGYRRVPVSKAVQASTALPGLYRPVRIGGRDYVDGGVQKTAHINRAISHGARFVVCVNPIVPILNDPARGPLGGHLSRRGLTQVLDQVFRITLHGRMQYGMERYRKEHPEVDILLIEPTRDDMEMFRYNIMELGARRTVAQYGYRSALAQLRKRRAELVPMLARHGIGMRLPRRMPAAPGPSAMRSPVARSLADRLEALTDRLDRGED